MHTIELHLGIRVSVVNHDAFREFLAQAIPYYESPGGIRIRLLQGQADPCDFIEVVEYQTLDDYQRDQRRVEEDEVMKGFLNRWRALLESPPRVETYFVEPTRRV